MIKSSIFSLLLLGVFPAGCVSVRSPEKVTFSIGGDEEAEQGNSPRHEDSDWDDTPADDEASPPPPRRESERHRPGRKHKSKWDIAADIGSIIIGDGVEGFIFYGRDVLTPPQRIVKLRARIKSYKPDADVEGITLGFYRIGSRKCLGRAKTDEEGYASIDHNFGKNKEGDHRFYVKVEAVNDDENRALLELPPALLMVSVRRPETSFVVVDLDRTLVDSSFFRVVLWDGGNPFPDSRRVMRRIAKTYDIIYLTHRPNDLTRTSRLWLEDQGYPDGVMILSTTRGMLGVSGRFKSARLRRVRKSFPDLRIGVGDKESDIEAYRENGMKAIWIPHVKDKPKDLRKLAKQMRTRRDPNIVVVENWRQINGAIFGNYHVTPTQFANMLDARAVERRKKDREKRRRHDDN